MLILCTSFFFWSVLLLPTHRSVIAVGCNSETCPGLSCFCRHGWLLGRCHASAGSCTCPFVWTNISPSQLQTSARRVLFFQGVYSLSSSAHFTIVGGLISFVTDFLTEETIFSFSRSYWMISQRTLKMPCSCTTTTWTRFLTSIWPRWRIMSLNRKEKRESCPYQELVRLGTFVYLDKFGLAKMLGHGFLSHARWSTHEAMFNQSHSVYAKPNQP